MGTSCACFQMKVGFLFFFPPLMFWVSYGWRENSTVLFSPLCCCPWCEQEGTNIVPPNLDIVQSLMVFSSKPSLNRTPLIRQKQLTDIEGKKQDSCCCKRMQTSMTLFYTQVTLNYPLGSQRSQEKIKLVANNLPFLFKFQKHLSGNHWSTYIHTP